MLKVRLQGTKEDIVKAITKMKKEFDVMSESEGYKNRNSVHYRVYLDLEIKKTH